MFVSLSGAATGIRLSVNCRLSREKCREACFDIMVGYHRNRILDRLGSVKSRLPRRAEQHRKEKTRGRYTCKSSPTPIIRVLKKLIDSEPSRLGNGKTTADWHVFKTEVISLWNAFEAFETSVHTGDSERQALQEIVKKMFVISRDGVSFAKRTRDLGFARSALEDRVVRQVGKTANYWRICIQLADASRKFPAGFRDIECQVLTPFRSERWPSGSGWELFVHAEIQLVTYYAARPSCPQPRVIGASKEACFLCNSFLRAFGSFLVSKTHGRLYSKWTVPDLAIYDEQTREKIRACLTTAYSDVGSAQKWIRHSKPMPYPNQSSINLWINHYSETSLLTEVSTFSDRETVSPIAVPRVSSTLSPVDEVTEHVQDPGDSVLDLGSHQTNPSAPHAGNPYDLASFKSADSSRETLTPVTPSKGPSTLSLVSEVNEPVGDVEEHTPRSTLSQRTKSTALAIRSQDSSSSLDAASDELSSHSTKSGHSATSGSLSEDGAAYNVTADQSVTINSDWLHLDVSFGTRIENTDSDGLSRSEDTESAGDSRASFTQGSVRVSEYIGADHGMNRVKEIREAEFPPGSVMVLQNPKEGQDFSFVLRKNEKKAVKVTCKWS